jgi:hypothetical protein
MACGMDRADKLGPKSTTHNYAHISYFLRIIRIDCVDVSAKMGKRRELIQKGQMPLDVSSQKRGRGRPQKIQRSWVVGRAPNYRRSLGYVWPELSGPLLAATTAEQVTDAFQKYAQSYASNFVPRFADDILALIHDPHFPRRRPKAQIGFLADSLAGRPDVTARRSRDICSEERAAQRAKSKHKILRTEFYIECSCGYKGPARDNACRKCGAEIPLSLGQMPFFGF